MKLSILLISYNTKKLTLNALYSIDKSLKNAPFKYEILVLDNNSTDGSKAALSFLKIKGLKLFLQQSNIGFGKANNFLANKAQGQYLLLLNSDTLVLEEGISKLLEFVESHPQYNFAGAKLLNQDKSPQPSCGPLYNPLVVFVALFLRGDYFSLTRYSPNQTKQVGWVSGACIMCSKSDYLKLQGFDSEIFMYMEEIDLFKRAKDAGLTVVFYPKAQFIHYGFASSGGKSQPVINVFKGLIYYYRKHYGKLANLYIKLLLKTKALTGYTLGILFNNQYLKTTYEKAYLLFKEKN